jgi:hypothetical protein
MNATTATPAPTSTQPALVSTGAGTGTAATADLAALGVARTAREIRALTVPLDAFAKRGGPDVAVSTDAGMVRVHAVFQLDPSTKEMSVSVVDEEGRLIRMIPPDSVAKMIAAMAAYRGR